MTSMYILQSREEDESKQGMPTLQFVNADDKESWLRITGDDLFRLEANRGRKLTPIITDAGVSPKKYRITIEEIVE